MHDKVEAARDRAKLEVLEERVEQLTGRIRTQTDVIHMQRRRIKKLKAENLNHKRVLRDVAEAMEDLYLD